MNRKYDAITIAILAFLRLSLGAAFAGCGNKRQDSSAAPETVSGVSLIVAHETTVSDWLESVGTVRAVQIAQVSSQTMGNILEVRAHEGDRVRAGQVLAVIDDAHLRGAVDQETSALAAAQKEVAAAGSDLSLAATTLQRYQQLYDKKSASPQEFDEVKARFQSAEAHREMAQARETEADAALTQARTSLGYTRVRAPFAGIVTAKSVDAGALAEPGMALFTVEGMQNYRLEATVDESDIHLLRVGQAATAIIDALGKEILSSKVQEIVPAADPSSRSFLVKLSLPADSRLRSGLFGRAHFIRGQRQALLIPPSSVVERGHLTGVYVIGTNQVAQLRYITLGRVSGEGVEVLSGLIDGETLVDAPGDREFGGKRIAAQP